MNIHIKLFLTSAIFALVLIFSVQNVSAQACGRDYLTLRTFYSNNSRNIKWEVGFNYISSYGINNNNHKTWKIIVDLTSSCNATYCSGGIEGQLTDTIGPLDGRRPYGIQWGTACRDPDVPAAQQDPTKTGRSCNYWFITPSINVTANASNSKGIFTNAAESAYSGGIIRFNGYYNLNNCPQAPPPPPPTGRSATTSCTSLTTSQINFEWNPIARDSNYDLRYKNNNSSNWNTINGIGTGRSGDGKIHRIVGGLADNTLFDWQVRGHTSGNWNGPTNWSANENIRSANNNACQPSTGPIGGTVFLPNGNPYRGNAFVIRNNVNNRDQTNNQGDYSFGGLQAGSRHDITLSHFGDGLNLPGGNGNKVDTCLYSANWTRQDIQVPNNSVNFRLNNKNYVIGGQLLWDPDGSGGGPDTRPYTSPTGRNVRITVRGQGSDITNNQARYSIGGIPTDSNGIKYTVEVDTSGADGIKPAHHVVGGNTRRVTISCANRPNVNFFIGPEGYDISGTIYVDDGDGVLDPGAGANRDQPYTGSYGGQFATVTVDNVRSDNVNGSGAYTVAGNPNGSRSVRLNINTLRPSYRNIITPPGNPRIVAVSGADRANINFLIARTPPSIWSLSGGLFIDTDPSRQRNGELYTNPLNPEKILINNRNLNTYADSRFDATGFYVPGLSAGVYDVEFPTPIRQNFVVSYHPGRYRITLGSTPNCPPPSTCNADGDAENIDFGISDNPTAQSWIQGVGGFMRSDQELSVTIPSGKYLSITSAQDSPSFPTLLSPGVIFNFNLSGNVSSKGWLVTNSAYRPGVIKTSYTYITDALKKGKANQHNMYGQDAVCGPSAGTNCFLDLNSEGYYYSTRDVIVRRFDIKSGSLGKDHIFRINGDLTIDSGAAAWDIPPGTTVIFVVSGNIIVNGDVNHIEGIFSADGDFIVNNRVNASQLVIEGSVIANAKRNSANTNPFNNNRDLDSDNNDTPAVKIIYRPDFVLNAPDLVRYSNYNFQEVAPEGR